MISHAGQSTDLIKPMARFTVMSANPPDPSQRAKQTQTKLRVSVGNTPIQRGLKVIMISFDPFDPSKLIGSVNFPICLFGKLHKISQMFIPDERFLPLLA